MKPEVIFLILAALALLTVAISLVLRLRRKRQPLDTDMDAALGARCVVTEEINNVAGAGLVRHEGHDWAARSLTDEDVLPIGKTVTVVAIEGVKLICK